MKLFTPHNQNHHPNSFLTFFAIFHTVVTVAFFFWISWSDKATNNMHIGEIKVFLITTNSAIIMYFFGSSKGDKDKGEMMGNLLAPKDGSTVITTRSPDPEVIKANEEVKQNEIQNQQANP